MSSPVQTGPLPVGTVAPDFTNVVATGGKTISLSDYRGQYVILVFYPKDQTPGCTKQLCALRDDLTQLNNLNTQVLGVNPDSLASHERFVAAQNYNFPILVDDGSTITRAYGAAKPEGGIQRTVYVVGPDGTVVFAEQGMPTDENLMLAIRNHRDGQ